MRFNRTILILLITACFLPGLKAADQLNIELVFDASKSMNAPTASGEKRIDVAKDVVSELAVRLDREAEENVNVGLRIYASRLGTDVPKDKACLDSALVVPMKGVDGAKIAQIVKAIKALGYTPIAYSLEQAANDFRGCEGQANFIVLVSDGKETCGGDPAAAAAKLLASGIGVITHCIGFDVDAATAQMLKSISDAGGGVYYGADDADELARALNDVMRRAMEGYSAAGAGVEPGKQLGTAAEIQDGEFKGDIAMHEALYYRVKVLKGQKIKAVLIVKKTKYRASNSVINQTFGITLFDNSGREIAAEKKMISGNPDDITSFKADWEADRSGWVYIAVSASNNHSEDGKPVGVYPDGFVPDPSVYTLKVKIKSGDDAEAEAPQGAFDVADAQKTNGGAGFPQAPDVKPGIVDGDIYMKETRFFKLPVSDGEKVVVSAVVQKPWYCAMNSKIGMTYTLKIYDEDYVEVARQERRIVMNPAAPASVTAECEVDDVDEVYISLNAGDNISKYGDVVSLYPEGFKPAPTRFSLVIEKQPAAK